MASQVIVHGLILSGRNKTFCPACAYGKQTRAHFPVDEHRQRAKSPGDLVDTDLCGPMSVRSVGGALYFVLFKDDHSGFRVIECIKNQPQTLEAFKRFVGQLKCETGNIVKILRSDCGTEYTSRSFVQYLDREMIKQELTTPYTPEQNGASERDNWTIVDREIFLVSYIIINVVKSRKTPLSKV